MAKTQAELEEEERNKGIMGFLRGLNPFSGDGGGFGLGSIFMMLLVVTGVYFLARNDGVQDFIGKWLDDDGKPGSGKEKVADFMETINAGIASKMPWLAKLLHIEGADLDLYDHSTPEKKKELLVKNEMPEAAATLIANEADFVQLAKDANGGAVSADNLLNDKTMMALLTKKPDFVKKLVPLLMPVKGGAAPTDKQKEQQAKIIASLQTMMTEENIATLFNATNRKNTIAILAAMTPGKTPEQMDKEITALCDKNGAPTAALTTMLSTMLTPGEEGAVAPDATATAKKILNDPNASVEVKKQLANAALADPEKLVGAANVVPFNVLMGGLGEQKAQEFVLIAANEDKTARDTAIKAFVMQKDTLPLFKVFADTANIAALPPEMQQPISKLKEVDPKAIDKLSEIAGNGVDPLKLNAIFSQPTSMGVLMQLMNADNRALLRQAGTDKVIALLPSTLTPETKALLTKHNLDVLLSAADVIGARAKALDTQGSTNGSIVAIPVLKAFMELMQKKPDSFQTLSASTISTFFADDQYDKGMRILVKGLALPKGSSDAALLSSLQFSWGTSTPDDKRAKPSARDGEGLAEVLADEKSMQVLLEYMKTDTVKERNSNIAYGWANKIHGESLLHYYLYKDSHAPAEIRENAVYIEKAIAAFSAAGVSLTGSASIPAKQQSSYNAVGVGDK